MIHLAAVPRASRSAPPPATTSPRPAAWVLEVDSLVRRSDRDRHHRASPLGLNAILAFWIADVLTRPLGASIGDYMSQAKKDGGLAVGTSTTSYIFLATILALVLYLTVTRVDQTPAEPD